jgi:hypothetical protein
MTSALVRYVIAEAQIRAQHTMGTDYFEEHDTERRRPLPGPPARSDEQILRDAGYQTSNDFWRDALSERKTIKKFAYLLSSFLLTPQRAADEIERRIVPFELEILSAIKSASVENVNWLSQAPTGDITVEPEAAARWLLQKPLRRELVPHSLREYLEGGTAAQPAIGVDQPPPARGRGPRPTEREKAKNKLRELASDLDSLDQLRKGHTEDSLAVSLGVGSRDTARKAFNELRSEYCRLNELRQSPTSDK